MIKAIAFDLGGVLFSEGKSVAKEKLSREYGYDSALVEKILTSPLSVYLRRGLLEDEEFWKWAQAELPPGYDARLIKKEWYDGYVLDEDIAGLLQKLRGRYTLIAFSGNVRTRVDYLEKKYGFRKLLDIEVYSFDHHRTKPDQKFVEIMIEESGCRAGEIAYIEDRSDYAEPARRLGINVLLYRRGKIRALERSLKGLGVEV